MPRKTLSELKDDFSPEMEAFRRGDSVQPQRETLPTVEEAKPKKSKEPSGEKRQLVVQLDAETYDKFVETCMRQKPRTKMAKKVREWIEAFIEEN